MASLVTIECRGPHGSRARTVLLDDEAVLTTSRDVIKTIGLKSGTETDGSTLSSQILEHEASCAELRALRLLNYRERTRHELEMRLTEDGYAPTCISTVLDRLVDLQLLDDARFACSYTRTKARSGWGLRRIRNGLKQAGVAPAILERAIESEYPGTDDERALEQAMSASPVSDNEVRRVIARLVRRGFSKSTARRAAFTARGHAKSEDNE